ncbi:MAG: VOC family protein [Alphaproteobacteria bacterium]|jgi:hypothetical protein|nr:VOC family protein [Alphaproteobacteria bacterium]MDP6268876.1 VOC family protein [Alphaproteobacteria bacterium]MDP7429575.1 VOC family protein [Alphaproteobacteria bacterium]|tara:strand:- start:533 stop:961 length:429 start_codon:yes stop_codon:yes gene_type:complete
MEQRVSLITLGVADLPRARAFYEALGWKASGFSNQHIVFFQIGGLAFSLYGREALAKDAGVPGRDPGDGPLMALAHNVRERAAVDSLLDDASAAGAPITQPARDTEWGGYAGAFADPDGHLWEIAWNPHFPLAADGSVTLPG